MEIKKKLKMSSGSIHDIRYHYNVIIGLKRKNGRVENNINTLEYFNRLMNDYNANRAGKYGVSKPKEASIEVVKQIVTELKYLGLIRKENEYLSLTDEGKNIATLIEKKDSSELKKIFVKLMLENFNIFEYFLKHIKEISNGNGVPIPSISSNMFDKCGGDSKKIAENYINIVNKNSSNFIAEHKKLYNLLENAKVDLIEKRTDKISKLQAIIEKFVISEAFAPNIQSRRVYDFVRSRTTFLELTNYANFNFEGFSAEVTYLISDFKPTFKQSITVDYLKGNIYINSPPFEEIRELLKESITEIYSSKKDEFGYMRISDVRNMVCRKLKISDSLFDIYLKRLYEEEPHWLSFTYSGAGDKITEKSLPIIFEKPMREFFTLLKINLRR